MKRITNLMVAAMAILLPLAFASCSGGDDSTESPSGITPTVTTQKITVSVTFDANGGEITTTTFSKDSESSTCSVSIPSAQELGLSRTGYIFSGWATDKNATEVAYTDAQNITFTESKTFTLYAIWKAGVSAAASSAVDVIKALTADSTVVITGSISTSGLTNIANALAEVPSVKVSIDFSGAKDLLIFNCDKFDSSTNLVSLVLPKDVCSIAGSKCASLENVSIAEENDTYSSEDGILYNKDKTSLFFYPAGKTAESFAVPASVTKIESSAFSENKHLKSVTTGDAIDTIGGYSFANCTSLESVTFGDALTKIEPYAFKGCSALTAANFNNTTCWWIIKNGNTVETSSCTFNTDASLAAKALVATLPSEYTYNYGNKTWYSPYGTITFNANGGTITTTTQKYKYNGFVNLKTAEELGLSRSGYTFKGWAKMQDATTPDYAYGSYYPSTSSFDVTLYAVWQAE